MAHMKPVFAMQQFDPNQTLGDSGAPGLGFGGDVTESRRFARAIAPTPAHKSKNQRGLSADQKHSFAAPGCASAQCGFQKMPHTKRHPVSRAR